MAESAAKRTSRAAPKSGIKPHPTSRVIDLRSRRSEQSQRQILAAAEAEFADKGLAGARVDAIAEASAINKQLIYYYYGSKEDLYLAVLERAYAAMRKEERELNLADLDPVDAIARLIEFKFDYYTRNPAMIRLLAAENMLNARYLKRSSRLREMHISLIDVLQSVLMAGERNERIRGGIDPVQLYLTIASLSYFYFSNAATLSTVFGRNLARPEERRVRTAHAVEFVLNYIRKT
jgi:AcrR family transcriptional regulator